MKKECYSFGSFLSYKSNFKLYKNAKYIKNKKKGMFYSDIEKNTHPQSFNNF